MSKINKWNEVHKPVILTLEDWDNSQESSVFSDQIAKMIKITNDGQETDSYSVIAVIGERGSGKTSVLKSYENVIKKSDNYVLGIVNPDIFESKLSILVIYLTELYNVLDKNTDNYQNDSDFSNTINQLRKVTGVLVDIHRGNEYLKDGIPNIDFLENINKRLNFEEELKKLTESVLGILNRNSKKKYSNFVIIVDDIDLSSGKVVYQLFDEVSKYLSKVANVVLSYRESQLDKSIVDILLEDQKNMLTHKIIDIREIQSQASNLISKLIPMNHRIFLKSKEEILNSSSQLLFESLDRLDIQWRLNKTEKNISDLIYDEIMYRTNLDLRSIDKKEDTSLFMPSSLRGILQLMEYIDVNMISGKLNKFDLPEAYLKNILALKSYLLSTMDETFSSGKIAFITNWLESPVTSKNFILYNYFYIQLDKYFESKIKFYTSSNKDISDKYEYLKEINSLKNSRAIEPYNISLGDVIEVLELYKFHIASSVYDYHFIYIIKVLFSLELNISLLETMMIGRIDNDNFSYEISGVMPQKFKNKDPLNEYFNLLNGLIFPENHNFYSYNKTEENNFATIAWGNIGNADKETDSNNNESNNKKAIPEKDVSYLEKIAKQYLIYSPYTIKSDVYANIRKGGHSFRYRKYYIWSANDFDNAHATGTRSTNQFRINPFAFFSDRDYVLDSLKKQFESSEPTTKSSLVLNNLFTIDYFLRKNYSRRSEKNYVSYALNSLTNGLFRELDPVLKGNDLYASFGLPLHLIKYFTDEITFLSEVSIGIENDKYTHRNFIPPYSQEDVENLESSLYYGDIKIGNYTLKQLISIARDGYKSKFLEVMRKVDLEYPDFSLKEIIEELEPPRKNISKAMREEFEYVITRIESGDTSMKNNE